MFSQDGVRWYNRAGGVRPIWSWVPFRPGAPSSTPLRHDPTTGPPPKAQLPTDPASQTHPYTVSVEPQAEQPASLDTVTRQSDQGQHQPATALAPGAAPSAPKPPTSSNHPPYSPASTSRPPGGAPEPQGDAGDEVYMRFRVEGIKCEGCAARLKAALLRLPGVARCAVDFGSKQVLVWGRGGSLAAADVRSAIQFTDMSYRVTLLESYG